MVASFQFGGAAALLSVAIPKLAPLEARDKSGKSVAITSFARHPPAGAARSPWRRPAPDAPTFQEFRCAFGCCMKQPLKKARCSSTKRLQTSRPSQGKLAGLGALVTEAVVAKVDVPEAAVAAEGARQGLRSRTPRRSAPREKAQAFMLDIWPCEGDTHMPKGDVCTLPCELRDPPMDIVGSMCCGLGVPDA